MNEVWIIIKSTGEYSDRFETPIRYCVSEEDAKTAIELIDIEKQRDILPEFPEYPESGGYKLPNGDFATREDLFKLNIVERHNLIWEDFPNVDEINAQFEILQQEYYDKIKALNHVDPEGSSTESYYYYSSATLWKPE